MSKGARRGANLPDPPVEGLPDLLEVPQEHPLETPRFSLRLQLGFASRVKRVDQLPEDVELDLLAGAVADPNRSAALVSRQPSEFLLGQPALSSDPVHDLKLVRTAGDGPQQPLAPILRLPTVARIEKGIERQCRVRSQQKR